MRPVSVDSSLRRIVLLEVARLSVSFGSFGSGAAVDDASFRVYPGETLALVGESGSGKTSAALAVLGLLPRTARVRAGEIRFRGRELGKLPPSELRRILGAEIGVVFQDPLAALDPVLSIGTQLREVLRVGGEISGAEARERALHLLARVGLEDPARVAREHAHRLSGGMRQRATIAMAIARSPGLLVADEPTSALDPTIGRGILELFRGLQAEIGMGMLLITHDLAVVAENAHTAAVLYAGRIVESAPVADLFESPRHPYTALLLRSHPSRAGSPRSGPAGSGSGARLAPIPGRVPAPDRRPSGCRFRDRCPIAKPKCSEVDPLLIPIAGRGAERAVACHYDEEVARL
jgi:oligopeptide/dipeptide ABC transporter ATP-binding protein